MHPRRRQWLTCGGCGGAVLLVFCWFLLQWTAGPYLIALTAAALAAIFVAYQLHRIRLGAEFRSRHASAGKDALIVYSNSARWHSYIEREWLPRWGHRAVAFDRSRPWKGDQIEARLWMAAAGSTEHTPVVIIVSRRGVPKVVRFWRAFRALEKGQPEELHALEARVDSYLGVDASDLE